MFFIAHIGMTCSVSNMGYAASAAAGRRIARHLTDTAPTSIAVDLDGKLVATAYGQDSARGPIVIHSGNGLRPRTTASEWAVVVAAHRAATEIDRPELGGDLGAQWLHADAHELPRPSAAQWAAISDATDRDATVGQIW